MEVIEMLKDLPGGTETAHGEKIKASRALKQRNFDTMDILDIYHQWGMKPDIVDKSIAMKICYVLSKVPMEIVEKIIDKKCLILVPTMAEGGFFISKKRLKGKDLILLPEKLFGKSDKIIEDVILHEIAHYKLGHQGIPEDFEFSLGDIEKIRDNEEKEAKALVEEWIGSKE
jgi:hypothetical protein